MVSKDPFSCPGMWIGKNKQAQTLHQVSPKKHCVITFLVLRNWSQLGLDVQNYPPTLNLLQIWAK